MPTIISCILTIKAVITTSLLAVEIKVDSLSLAYEIIYYNKAQAL